MTVNGLPNAGLYANGFTHPNEGGYAQLANAWFNAVASLEGIPQRVTATWDNAGGTGDGKTWDVAASQNWNNGVPAQFNQSDNVMFNDSNNGNYSVTLNSTVAPTLVTFANNSGNYVLSGTGSIGGAANIYIDGAGTVTLNISNSYSGATSVNEGTLVITNAAALPASTQLTIGNGLTPVAMKLATGIGLASVATLAMNADATLDITNNSLAINYGDVADPAGYIRSYLQNGNIFSSTAQQSGGVFAVGYADGNIDQGTAAAPGQVLVKYTLAGDANLDGAVNFADLLVVAQNFNHTLDTHGNTIDWADGDFNYDGQVNFADLLLVAQNFNKSLSAGQLDQLPGSFAADWQLAQAEIQAGESNNVPEPAGIGLLSVLAAALARRRRSVGNNL
jgi:autotransporter-associated beta strand protein